MHNPLLYELMKVQNKDHKMMQEAVARRNKDEEFQKVVRFHSFAKIVSYISVFFFFYLIVIQQIGQNNEASKFFKIFDQLLKARTFALFAAAAATAFRFAYAKKLQEHYKIINDDFYRESKKERKMSFPLESASAKEIVLNFDGTNFTVPVNLILNKDDYMSKVELEYEQYLMPVFRITPKNKLKFSGFRLSANYNKKQI